MLNRHGFFFEFFSMDLENIYLRKIISSKRSYLVSGKPPAFYAIEVLTTVRVKYFVNRSGLASLSFSLL